ncbi:MAG: hypothetical protein EP330_04095 [Deltaproteobacteria bacterium]|nr:MAG: hypothetical protein EP330_04095 [Deltaproteobacteria bacterium]
MLLMSLLALAVADEPAFGPLPQHIVMWDRGVCAIHEGRATCWGNGVRDGMVDFYDLATPRSVPTDDVVCVAQGAVIGKDTMLGVGWLDGPITNKPMLRGDRYYCAAGNRPGFAYGPEGVDVSDVISQDNICMATRSGALHCAGPYDKWVSFGEHEATQVVDVGTTTGLCFRNRKGEVWCWGQGDRTRYAGIGSDLVLLRTYASEKPERLPVDDIVDLDMGDYGQLCFARKDGRAGCTEHASFAESLRGLPVEDGIIWLPGIEDARQVALRYGAVCALRSDRITCFDEGKAHDATFPKAR